MNTYFAGAFIAFGIAVLAAVAFLVIKKRTGG